MNTDQNKQENNKRQDINQQQDVNENANSAYSGSGSMQPGGDEGKAGILNDFFNQNLEEVQRQSDSIPENLNEDNDVNETESDYQTAE